MYTGHYRVLYFKWYVEFQKLTMKPILFFILAIIQQSVAPPGARNTPKPFTTSSTKCGADLTVINILFLICLSLAYYSHYTPGVIFFSTSGYNSQYIGWEIVNNSTNNYADIWTSVSVAKNQTLQVAAYDHIPFYVYHRIIYY